jgi:hypothetical protein
MYRGQAIQRESRRIHVSNVQGISAPAYGAYDAPAGGRMSVLEPFSGSAYIWLGNYTFHPTKCFATQDAKLSIVTVFVRRVTCTCIIGLHHPRPYPCNLRTCRLRLPCATHVESPRAFVFGCLQSKTGYRPRSDVIMPRH